MITKRQISLFFYRDGVSISELAEKYKWPTEWIEDALRDNTPSPIQMRNWRWTRTRKRLGITP